jgi:hypothetical protein
MSDSKVTRREFVRDSAIAAAAAATGLSTTLTVRAGNPEKVDTSKILNYNSKMTYRPLGKTGFMISEVALGGHGGSTAADRVPVLERAVELGMNYVDNNIDQECDMYGAAMAKSKTAGRSKWFIGFASWPEKLTTEFESQLTPEGMMKNIEARLKSYKTDMLDMWRPVGATWGPGQNSIGTLLMVSEKTLDLVAGVFEKAKRQGKVRYLGVSAHNPKVFTRVLKHCPQFSVIIFPYLFLTKELGGDSLLKMAQEKNVGVIGLKPFGAGTTFGIKPREIRGKVDPRAHVLVKEMLKEPRISAIIPGVNIVSQLEENVKGSYEKDQPQTPADKKALAECTRNYYATLTPDYQWLHQWHRV